MPSERPRYWKPKNGSKVLVLDAWPPKRRWRSGLVTGQWNGFYYVQSEVGLSTHTIHSLKPTRSKSNAH